MFDEIVSRRNTNCIKYDMLGLFEGNTDDVICLCIADMDFKVPKKVIEDLKKRAEHGIFGYTNTPNSYFEAMKNWYLKRNNFDIDLDFVSFSPSVLTSLSYLVSYFSNEGDNILVQTPAYPAFFKVINDWNRNIVTNELYENNLNYEIDFEDFEFKVQSCKIFILCNPHNPVGKVFSRNDLERINKICEKYGVLVISDEIHCDIVFNNNFTHFRIVSDSCITLLSTAKTFNLAGLQASSVVFNTLENKNNFDLFLKRFHIKRNSCFNVVAVESSYLNGFNYVDDLRVYLQKNMQFVYDFINGNFDNVFVKIPEATYLMWVDCRKLNIDNLQDFFKENARIVVFNGSDFGSNGVGFIRINVAVSFDVLSCAMGRFKKAIDEII